MSRLTDLISKAKSEDPQFGADLEREFRALSSRLSFGLNFERHKWQLGTGKLCHYVFNRLKIMEVFRPDRDYAVSCCYRGR
jgi:hypothetical protein